MENGKREPRLSLLGTIAERLGIPVSELLEPTAPSERAGLEIELDRAQSSQVYAELGLPVIRAGKGMGDDTLRALVGLHQELARRSREAIATPEEARRANTELRAHDARARQPPARDRGARRGSAAQGRPRRRRAHAPLGAADGRAARVRARARARPAALRPVGHRPRERPHLPAAGLDPRRPRPAVDGAAGDRAPPARARGADQLRRVPASAARDQLLRVRVPHAAHPVGRVPAARRRPTATSRSRTSATRSARPTRRPRCGSRTSRRRTST